MSTRVCALIAQAKRMKTVRSRAAMQGRSLPAENPGRGIETDHANILAQQYHPEI